MSLVKANSHVILAVIDADAYSSSRNVPHRLLPFRFHFDLASNLKLPFFEGERENAHDIRL